MNLVTDITDGAMHHLGDMGSGKDRRIEPALAAAEQECCAFADSQVTTAGESSCST